MILLLSGEGASDIGTLSHDQSFRPGPMAWFVDKLVETIWDYSPLGTDSMEFVPEGQIDKDSRSRKKAMVLPGKKRTTKGTAHFFKNARALARLAREREKFEGCEVASVFFRDTDGTRSTKKGLWKEKVASMNTGFAAEKYERGIPMVPKPKSEAWLICALQENPYQNCKKLEDELPGNEKAPLPAKDILAELMQKRGEDGFSVEMVNDWIGDGTIDLQRIDMPSFNAFKERLIEVAHAMVGKPHQSSHG